ncbi:hypothetical protein LCGC14_2942840, partial [marine sediment metagenome]
VKACVVGTAAWETLWKVKELNNRHEEYDKAAEYAHLIGKPLMVVGQTMGRHPCGDVCVDIAGCPTCSNSVTADVQDLFVFEDKNFGAAFASHVLEHIDSPDLAWMELNRVADKVFIAYPFSHRLTSTLHGHKWFVNKTAGGYLFTAINGGEKLFLSNDGTVLYQ